MTASTETLQTVRSLSQEGYKYGFVTDIEAETAPPGLNEDTVRFISAKKDEPEWLLEWRLAAYRAWREMVQPNWAKLNLAPIDYEAATYYSAPKQNTGPKSLDEVDPRSEEHTSELQSRFDLVCRLLLEKKNPMQITSLSPHAHLA